MTEFFIQPPSVNASLFVIVVLLCEGITAHAGLELTTQPRIFFFNPEFLILLPPSPKCWVYQYEPLSPALNSPLTVQEIH